MSTRACMNDDRWVDLHVHTTCSDGTDTPKAVAEAAAARGVTLLAIADHNTDAGIAPAREACEGLGILLLPAVEIDLECQRGELHLLVYGGDPSAMPLRRVTDRANATMIETNWRTLWNIRRAGYPVELNPQVNPDELSGSQLHVAIRNALLDAGLALNARDAYRKFLLNPAYRHAAPRLTAAEVLPAVADAGGVASLAHPCRLKMDDEATIRGLAEAGLWGLEAYYGDGGEVYVPRALELARRYGLRPTIGSDYHGGHRASVLGMRVPQDPALWEALDDLEARATSKTTSPA